MMQATSKKTSKSVKTIMQGRLVLIGADKGGTGKSTFARGVVDLYRYLGVSCNAYDSDRRNSQLYRHYNKLGGVSRIDIATRGEADALLDDLENSKPTISLVDLPAGAGEWFEQLEADLDLITSATELGYRLTMVSVLSRNKDPINALRLLMDYCADRVDYVVVKNLYYGDAAKFKRFDSSKTRTQFLKLNGIEIVMPDLFDDTYDLIDEKDLTFREAIAETSPLTRSHRSRINQWLKLMEREICKADTYLGLSNCS